MLLQPVILTSVVLVASSWAAEKQIKLEDIERDNLKGSKDQAKVLQQPQFQYQAQLDPQQQQQLQLQQQLLAQQQQQLLSQQQYLLAQPAQVLPPGGQFAYYPSLPAFQGNQLQPSYVSVSPEQVQALAAQYQQQQQQQQQQQPALPQQAYLAALQYVPATVQSQPRPQPEQQLLQYQQQQQQQNYLQQFQGGARVPHSLQPQAPPQLSSPPEAPEPTVQYSSGEVYSTIPYSSKQDYSVQLTNPTPQEQQYNFQQATPPRLYNPYNALLHPQQQQQQQKTLFAAGAKSTAAPPVKALSQAGFLPSSSINHPGQGFSFSNYRRGPPGNF